VKICSCPKRDMDREERDTQLQKNTVFRRTKKCISEDNHHDNGPPRKVVKLEESSTSTGLESGNINNMFTLLINYNTNNKENYKKILESVYSVIVGVSSLHNIQDTQPLLKDLEFKLHNLE